MLFYVGIVIMKKNKYKGAGRICERCDKKKPKQQFFKNHIYEDGTEHEYTICKTCYDQIIKGTWRGRIKNPLKTRT